MIMNNLINSTAYGDWWSHLESINHTIIKVLNEERATALNDLDRERLHALIEFLTESYSSKYSDDATTSEFLSKLNETRLSFVPDINLLHCLREAESFKKWQSRSKLGFEKKIQKLIENIQKYMSSSKGMLFLKDAPNDEFKILKELIEKLLAKSQSFLY